MRKDNSKGTLFILLLTFSCITVVSMKTFSSSGTRQNLQKERADTIQIQLNEFREKIDLKKLNLSNKTSSLSLSKMERVSNELIRFSLKNNSSKKINGYFISWGSKTILVDYTLSDKEENIPPYGDFVLEQHIDLDPDLYSKGFSILAVVFDDGTSEGDTPYVNNILDYREGNRVQIKKAISFLEKYPSQELSPDRIKRELNTFVEDFGNSKVETSVSQYIKFGMNDAKEVILGDILKLTSKPSNDVKNDFSTLLILYKKKLKT